MTAVECDNRSCNYNDRGFCEAEVIEIRNGKCVTPEIDKELGVFEECDE